MFFFSLIMKEIKLQIRSIAFVLCLVLISLLFLTEMKVEDINLPLKPLDEMHYLYYVLINDYIDGNIDMTKVKLIGTIELEKEEKEKIKNVIYTMNPNWRKGFRDVENAVFSIDNDKFQLLLDELNEELGGNTYYKASLRSLLFESYTISAYGYTRETESREIINAFVNKLEFLYQYGKITQYSMIGLGKDRVLQFEEKIEIKSTIDSLHRLQDNNLTEDERKKDADTLLYQLDKFLGGNTEFGDNIYNLGGALLRRRTYVEATVWFENLSKGKDKITNAYARTVADLMGVLAGILPAFLAAFVLIRDRKYHMQELIYYRSYSSGKYILSKFIAVSSIFLVIFMLLATYYTIIFNHVSHLYQYDLDYFAFYKYTILWILPTILFTVSFCCLLSITFESGLVALAVQLILYVLSITSVGGDYRWFKVIIRMNGVSLNDEYMKYNSQIISNRISICILAILFLVLTVKILNWRRTIHNGWNLPLFRNSKVQS